MAIEPKWLEEERMVGEKKAAAEALLKYFGRRFVIHQNYRCSTVVNFTACR